MRNDPIHAPRRFAIPLALALMAIQAGCLSGPAPADHFYRLEVPAAASRLDAPRLAGRLLVDSVRGDAMTLERPMLYRSPDDPAQVKREGYDQWVDPPPVMVQHALVGFLRSANAAAFVITPEVRLDADFRLYGHVNRFERVVAAGSSRATIELELSVVRLEDRELLLMETYREEEDVAGGEVGDAVDAFGRALQRILERFLADLPQG